MISGKKIAWWSVSFVVVVVALNVLFMTWPAGVLQMPLVVNEEPRTTDVIIVLGAGARKHGDPLPPQAKERVQRGVQLLNEGYAPRMIVAGGLSKQSGYVEAELMQTYAMQLGVPSDSIVKESSSKNTWENAVNALEIMRRNEWDDALVVTSSYHTLRACMIFRKLKATVRCVAAPLSTIPTDTIYERLTDFRSVAREYGAIVYFVFLHYL